MIIACINVIGPLSKIVSVKLAMTTITVHARVFLMGEVKAALVMCLHNKWKLHTPSTLQDTYFCINLVTIFLPVCTIQSFNNILRCQLIPLPPDSQPSSISPPASLLPSPRLLHTLNPPFQQSYRIRGWCVYRTRKLGVAFVLSFRFRPMFLFSSYILFSSHIFHFRHLF